jgi:thioredoxin 1
MKNIVSITAIIISLISSNCSAGVPEGKTNNTLTNDNVSQLTDQTFKKLVFNYDLNKTWKYEVSKPAIIDFYADWCPPCRQLSPLVEEIAKEYKGKIVVYKVNTDNEKALARSMGITGLPTLLYIPSTGKPQITVGMIPKETLVKTVNEILLKHK